MPTYYGWDDAPSTLMTVPILVGSVNGNSGWGWPSGSSPGDLCMIYGIGNDEISFTGWNTLPKRDIEGSSGTDMMWKVLDGADLVNPNPPAPVEGFGFLCMMVWRGVDTCIEASVGTANASGESIITGFTKNANSKFVVVTQSDRDPGGSTYWTYPIGFTGILAANNAYFSTRLSYMPSSAYGGGNLSIPLIASAYGGRGIAYELYKA